MMYQIHPIAEIFPRMTGEEFVALKEDIKHRGLLEPIWLYAGKVLDGRHRYYACQEVGKTPEFREYAGDDPVGFVLSLNLRRRHLDTSQRSMVAARVATLPKGVNQHTENSAPSQSQAAQTLNVSADSIQFAKKVIAQAAPEVAAAVDAGILPVSQAAKLADAAPEFQRAVVQKMESGEAKKATEAIRQVRHQGKKEAPAPTGKYRVIYADPPWQYGNAGAIGDTDSYGRAERHYPTMSIAELCELPIKDVAEDNAVLFLWVTSPLLEESFEVIRAWGFKYKTSFVWDKIKHNFGHYNSVRHEFLLICTRGSCTPDVGQLFDSVQTIERSDKHSQKPQEFRQIIDTLYTHGGKLELFARELFAGWEAWGNEPDAQSVA